MVFKMCDRWSYSCCFVECCLQDFNIDAIVGMRSLFSVIITIDLIFIVKKDNISSDIFFINFNVFHIEVEIPHRILKWTLLGVDCSNSVNHDREKVVCYITRLRETTGEVISDVLLWIPSHSRTSVGQPTETYLKQLCTDTRCSIEDLPRAMVDRDEWREWVREIRANITTWCVLWWDTTKKTRILK